MLVSATEMLKKAKAGHYAVGQFNINNLEWTKAILLTAKENRSPVILGVSEGAGKYMGGYDVVVGMVNGLLKDLDIDVPVALHLDHGTFEGCYKCIEAGFSSIMFDGSHYPIDENIAKTAEKQKKNFAGTEISGKKLGVIGLGAIGVLVANAATHLGMEVYGYDPYISVNAAWNLSRSVKHISNVEDIYKECDFITIHVPLLDSTKKMIDAKAIAMMKPTAIVLNFARDLLVDEEAMVDALAAGKIKKYVSDFPNTTTVGAKGCIVTPHLGASTAESEDNCAIMAVREIRDYMENGNITHSVNFPDCNMAACTTAGRIGILHKNVKGMIAQYTTILGEADINVADMTNKAKGDYAYALIDVDSPVTDEVVEKLKAIDDVLRVRVIK